MKKNIIVYNSRNKYAQEITDLFLAIENKVPEEERMFFDTSKTKANEIFDFLVKNFNYDKSTYITKGSIKQDPIYLFVQSGFANHFDVEERWIKRDDAKLIKEQQLDKYYPDKPIPPVVPPTTNPNTTTVKDNSNHKIGLIALALVAVFFIFKK